MNKMFLIAVAMCFMFVGEASAQRGRRNRKQYVPQVTQVQPALVTPSTNVSKIGEVCEDALAEVNKTRAERGLKPYIHDPLLAKGALACAKYRAERLIAGHCPGQMGDFAFLPSEVSVNGVVGGCAAWTPDWGWGACATYDNYTYCGAAYVVGSDGRRYMHLFVK